MNPAQPLLEALYQEEIYRIPSSPVVVLDREWDQLTADDVTLLTKILSAVKLTLPLVRIISRQQCDPEQFSILNPSHILCFGAKPGSPEHERYRQIDVGGTSVVYADALSELDDARKKSLWQVLRAMFAV